MGKRTCHSLKTINALLFGILVVTSTLSLLLLWAMCNQAENGCFSNSRRTVFYSSSGANFDFSFKWKQFENDNNNKHLAGSFQNPISEAARKFGFVSTVATSKVVIRENGKSFSNTPARSGSEILDEYSKKGAVLRKKFNCSKLFAHNDSEMEKVRQHHARYNGTYTTITSENAVRMLEDCNTFKKARGYGSDLNSDEEQDFPIAFIVLVHRDFEHLERLLRLVYRPQNIFCIHVDAKVDESLKRAVASLAECFPNVILASKPQKIVYAHISRLNADMICMKDLLAHGAPWKYLFNMAATELPLRTNLEMVKILKTFHGLNDIRENYRHRMEKRFIWDFKVENGAIKRADTKHPPPPHNLTITKGMAYNSFSREFVEWALTDQRSKDLLAWSEATYSPDEHYWATLNNLFHNGFLQTPGGFYGHPESKGYVSRYISWQYEDSLKKCQGRIIRHICIFSAFDLHVLITMKQMAANKFDLTFDPIAYGCMEEQIQRKTSTGKSLSLNTYENLFFVKFKPDLQTTKPQKSVVSTTTRLTTSSTSRSRQKDS
ncbi:beta-1,3-galactosyl-O-glycosyl-glycoprotein beta-1,6-N-acetylglucosaminyltransferase [Aplysia californica]|uniref:Beta-1,3-galactosyl-O-glycosyl-glycoprotein beta-1,6-N-acetylglucosaminyltransferase n=1 Tax=Aplysia californica TaxID=6500 RepID=A0ABM0KAY0_APLCA|nr:beta-1,3-galactosyl-O-glycosyl-glycoprotein beta-1,6-N-acetylglucosaminyltransferase [Aplysia californica]